MTQGADDRIAAAAAAVHYEFADPSLLAEALTHPSVQGGGHDYQRFEFLGDRVLGLVVADMLLAAFPGEDEGALAKRHAALVRRETLARVAADIGLGGFIELSKGEEETGGRSNPALLADAIEAVIGALYLDGGLAAAEPFIRQSWTPIMEAAESPPQDAKTRLQEWAQAAARPLPRYRTIATEGPPHSPVFTVEASVRDHPPITATGASKRAAEQAAAACLLAKLGRSKDADR